MDVTILNCNIPETGLLNGAIYKRFQRFHAGEDVQPVTSWKFLQSVDKHGIGVWSPRDITRDFEVKS